MLVSSSGFNYGFQLQIGNQVIQMQASAAGMSLLVNLLEPGRVEMRVNLGGGNIRMPQHELQSPQIGALPEEMGGEGMSEGVRAEMRRQAGLPCIPLQDFPKALAA